MSHCHPTLPIPPATMPSISVATAMVAPDPVSAAPYGSAAGTGHQVHCLWFHCLEWGEYKHHNIERKWCIGLWWPLFNGLMQQPTINWKVEFVICGDVVMGEEAQLCWSALGSVVPLFGATTQNNRKNREMGGALTWGGRLLIMTKWHNNQPSVGIRGSEEVGAEAQLGRHAWGGALSHCLGWQLEQQQKCGSPVVIL